MPHKSNSSLFDRLSAINSPATSRSDPWRPELPIFSRGTHMNRADFNRQTIQPISSHRTMDSTLKRDIRSRPNHDSRKAPSASPFPRHCRHYDECFVSLNTIRHKAEAGFDQTRFFLASTTDHLQSPSESGRSC